LIRWLKERGHTVVLASSAKEQEVDHYIDLLDARELADDWTTSADVKRTKPAPDLVESALKKIGAERGVMIGDSTFDVEAAANAGIPTLAVLTGGFSDKELLEAGAKEVFRSMVELADAIDEKGLDRLTA
jgi:phosphoglycolate phosphatase-like HAD superfamily hydrolase